MERGPGRVPIQRDGDPRVTCHVLATALTPSSASVTAVSYRPRAGVPAHGAYASFMRSPRAGFPKVTGSRSCRSPVSALIRPGPSARGPVPGAASPGPEGNTQRRSPRAPQLTRTQDNHNRGVQPIRRPIHSQPGISRTMTARQHSPHRDSPAHVPRPQARGTPPVLSQPEPGIEAVLPKPRPPSPRQMHPPTPRRAAPAARPGTASRTRVRAAAIRLTQAQSGVAAAQFGVGGDGQAALGAGGLVRCGGAQSRRRVRVVLRLAPRCFPDRVTALLSLMFSPLKTAVAGGTFPRWGESRPLWWSAVRS